MLATAIIYKSIIMNKNRFFFFSCLAILSVATVSMVFAKNSQSLINNRANLDKSTSANRDEIINSRIRHRADDYTEQRNRFKKSSAKSSQNQQTAVNLSSSDLNEANLLSISASQPETQLTASVSFNGQLIKSLTDDDNVLDLSPYLTMGKQVVSISGNYAPDNASIEIAYRGKTTRISQKTTGTGKLQQQFIFHVK